MTTGAFSRCTSASPATSWSVSRGWAATVGIIGNQPAHLAGVLDIHSSLKGARFIRFCDAFNIPLVTFEDVPGFLPGLGAGARWHHHARRQAALRLLRGHGAEADGDHPQGLRRRLRRDVVSKHIRGDVNLAWPTAEIAVMGAEGAAKIVFRKDIEGRGGQGRDRGRLKRSGGVTRRPSTTPYKAAARGYIDDVIEPRKTRSTLIRALELTSRKRDRNPPRKHGNIPL